MNSEYNESLVKRDQNIETNIDVIFKKIISIFETIKLFQNKLQPKNYTDSVSQILNQWQEEINDPQIHYVRKEYNELDEEFINNEEVKSLMLNDASFVQQVHKNIKNLMNKE